MALIALVMAVAGGTLIFRLTERQPEEHRPRMPALRGTPVKGPDSVKLAWSFSSGTESRYACVISKNVANFEKGREPLYERHRIFGTLAVSSTDNMNGRLSLSLNHEFMQTLPGVPGEMMDSRRIEREYALTSQGAIENMLGFTSNDEMQSVLGLVFSLPPGELNKGESYTRMFKDSGLSALCGETKTTYKDAVEMDGHVCARLVVSIELSEKQKETAEYEWMGRGLVYFAIKEGFLVAADFNLLHLMDAEFDFGGEKSAMKTRAEYSIRVERLKSR
jgi:hypothetical protein